MYTRFPEPPRAGAAESMSVDAYLEALEEATGLGALIDHVGGPTEPAFLAVVLAAGLFLGLVLGPARLGMALMLVGVWVSVYRANKRKKLAK